MRALFSVWKKSIDVSWFARGLSEAGHEIIASSGTKKFLKENGLKVTDTSEITGLQPVLGHRVATLCPQLHGGLLANLHEPAHIEELARLGWPTIDLVVVTFYPLLDKMRDTALTTEEVNESVDIGGPTVVSSACKGDRIVVTDETDFDWVLDIIKKQCRTKTDIGFPRAKLDWLQAVAAATVAQYRSAETLFRVRKLRSSVVGC